MTDEQPQEGAYARMKRSMKPTGKTFKGGQDAGNGDPCPINPEHGRTYVFPTGYVWCPHVDHTSGKVVK